MGVRAVRWCGVILTLALAGISAAEAAPLAAGPAFQTNAPNAILVDADSGTVLFEKDADVLVPPASMAKLMTAEVVFEALHDGKLKLDDRFVVSEGAWRRGGAPSRGSTMFAAVNSMVSVGDLLRGLAVVSGNDSCIALAEGMAGTETAFVTRLTDRARTLGLDKASFTTAWGKDEPGERMTPRELATLTRHIIRTYPDLYPFFGEREFTWNKIRQSNRNPLLSMTIGADGVKTGETDGGGYGLVGSAVQDGERLILVVTGLRTAKERASEAAKLLAWGFRAFERKTLFQAGEPVGSAAVFGGEVSRVPLVADGAVSVLQPREGAEPLTGRIVYLGPLPAPLEQGATVAHLRLMRGRSEVLDVPLRTAQNVAVGSLPRRAFDAGLELIAGVIQTHVIKR